ncbi:hypothetical protein [Micromonospora zamorensis]|uniref:hypothetical protein n=1 Tax=Micromonospora zamorensis TaxID=709883 RepID=UPI0037971C90
MSRSRADSAHWWIAGPVVATAGVFVGCWWWLRGYTVIRDPACGWRRWAGVAVRLVVLAAASWVLSQPGTMRWWGLGAILFCGGWGWLAYLRLLAGARQETRLGQALVGDRPPTASVPVSDAPPELAEQMRRLVLQRRLRIASQRGTEP